MVAVAQSSRSLEMRVTRVRKARAVPATRRKRTPLRPGRGSWHTSTSKWERGSGPPAPPCRQASRNGCGWRHRQRAAAVACRRAAIRASGGRELVSFTLQGNRSSLGAVSVLSQGRWQLRRGQQGSDREEEGHALLSHHLYRDYKKCPLRLHFPGSLAARHFSPPAAPHPNSTLNPTHLWAERNREIPVISFTDHISNSTV